MRTILDLLELSVSVLQSFIGMGLIPAIDSLPQAYRSRRDETLGKCRPMSANVENRLYFNMLAENLPCAGHFLPSDRRGVARAVEGSKDRGTCPGAAYHGAETNAERSPKGRSVSPGTRPGVASSGQPRGEGYSDLGGLKRRGGSGRHGMRRQRGPVRAIAGAGRPMPSLWDSPTDTGGS